jgi:deoxycytidylate deaminase
MKDGKFIAQGSNEIQKDNIVVCPREAQNMKTGEGYELCKSECGQLHHAEIDACLKAGDRARGGVLYLIGHEYCCNECQQVMMEHGIESIVIIDSILKVLGK